MAASKRKTKTKAKRRAAPTLATLRKLFAAGGMAAVREHLDKTCIVRIDGDGIVHRGEETN